MSNASPPADPLVFDWCARALKLRAVEEALLSGEMVTEARLDAEMTRFASAKLSEVKSALDEAIANCAASRGEMPKRRRYAIPARARPY